MSIAATFLSAMLLVQPAATQPVDPASDRVQTLVAQLSDADPRQRDLAQRALLNAGNDILPALQAARATTRDPDVQLRLDTMIVQLQERADVGGSRITLKVENEPLDKVLEIIETQANAKFADLVQDFGQGNGEQFPKVTLDLDNVSFWQTLREIQDQANVGFVPQPDGWRVMRNFGQMSRLIGADAGAFLVQPTMAMYSRNIQYNRNAGAGNENFNIQLTIFAEPKIRLSGGQGMLTVDRAVDSNGNDLIGGQRNQPVGIAQGQNQINCAIPLKFPKSPGETITEISGTLRLSMARRVEALSTDDLLNGEKLTGVIDGVSVVVESFAPDDRQSNLRVIITVENKEQGDNAQLERIVASLQQQIRVTDSRGVMLRQADFKVNYPGQHAEIRVELRANSSARGPYRMRLEVPTSYRDVEVPFVLRDLQMP